MMQSQVWLSFLERRDSMSEKKMRQSKTDFA